MAAPLSLTRTAHLPVWTVTVTWQDGTTTRDQVHAASGSDAVAELAGFLAVDPAVFTEAQAVRS